MWWSDDDGVGGEEEDGESDTVVEDDSIVDESSVDVNATLALISGKLPIVVVDVLEVLVVVSVGDILLWLWLLLLLLFLLLVMIIIKQWESNYQKFKMKAKGVLSFRLGTRPTIHVCVHIYIWDVMGVRQHVERWWNSIIPFWTMFECL